MRGEAPPPNDESDLDILQQDPGLKQTEDNCARALREQKYGNLAAFFSVDASGKPLLSDAELARVGGLMGRLRVEQDMATWPYKDPEPPKAVSIKAFVRNRPFIEHGSVHVCPGTNGVKNPDSPTDAEKQHFQKDHGYSFPSAHAATAEVQARVLGLIFPDRKDRLLARARQIGRDREVLRVHYPSDVDAGFRVGTRIFESIRESPRLKRDVAAITDCRSYQQ